MNVGRYDVTPLSSSASPAFRNPSASASSRSTPPKPFTWRSTKPGAAIPGTEFLVRRGDLDHQVAVGLAEPDHREGGDRVQDELLRGSGLQARRAGDELRADDGGQLVVADPRQLRIRDGDDACREGAGRSRRRECAGYVRRAPARADPDDGVVRGDAEGA